MSDPQSDADKVGRPPAGCVSHARPLTTARRTAIVVIEEIANYLLANYTVATIDRRKSARRTAEGTRLRATIRLN